MSQSSPASWVAIQRNPSSGSGIGREELVRLVLALQNYGYHVRIFKNREELQRRLEIPEVRNSLRCLIAAGGDGTVNDVINRYSGVPICLFPMGTENLLAKYLKISPSGESLAKIVHQGRIENLDLCQVNGRKFLLMMSFGLDAEIVRRTSETRRGHISKLDYAQPLWASVRNYEYPEIRVYVDDESEPIRGKYGIICNVPAYALQLPFAQRANPFDGQLDLRLFEKGSLWSTMEYLYYVTNNWHEHRDDVKSLTGSRFRIESDQSVPLQVDGDPAGFTPATIEVTKSVVPMIVPEQFAFGQKERIPQ